MSRFYNQAKRITGDFVISILASVIYTFARQIVVFPLLAARLSDESYGVLLTVTGLANVCNALIGGALNNVRLIQNNKYLEQRQHGDFLFLCSAGCAVSIGFSFVLWHIFQYSLITAVLFTIQLLISNFYQYASSFFRLELNFKRILCSNVFISLAYIAATPFFATKTLWPTVFLIGEGAGLIYVYFTTGFHREPFGKTPLFKETSQKWLTIMASNLLANLLMYADRMILYPILGAASVSYYATASFFGKCAGIVMTPISGVLLGYFSQKNFTASKKLFALINVLSLGCGCIFLFGCWLFAPFFTQLLYPSLFEQSQPYILLANLGAVISILGNMAQPMILKSCHLRWSLVTQILYGASYVLFSMWLLPTYGLLGFCWATIISNCVRLFALYAIGFFKL